MGGEITDHWVYIYINNGNRTECSRSNPVCNRTNDCGSPICLITSVITDRIVTITKLVIFYDKLF